MSKQDRQGVRKASDIEQKYNLALLNEFGESVSQQKSEFSKYVQEFSQFAVGINARIQLLESMVISVGSVYTTLSEDNPSELFGGEWELIAKGQIVLGHESESELPELFQSEQSCFIWKRIS